MRSCGPARHSPDPGSKSLRNLPDLCPYAARSLLCFLEPPAPAVRCRCDLAWRRGLRMQRGTAVRMEDAGGKVAQQPAVPAFSPAGLHHRLGARGSHTHTSFTLSYGELGGQFGWELNKRGRTQGSQRSSGWSLSTCSNEKLKNGARDRIKRWDKSGYNLPRKAINLYNEEPPTRKVGEMYEPGTFGSGEPSPIRNQRKGNLKHEIEKLGCELRGLSPRCASLLPGAPLPATSSRSRGFHSHPHELPECLARRCTASPPGFTREPEEAGRDVCARTLTRARAGQRTLLSELTRNFRKSVRHGSQKSYYWESLHHREKTEVQEHRKPLPRVCRRGSRERASFWRSPETHKGAASQATSVGALGGLTEFPQLRTPQHPKEACCGPSGRSARCGPGTQDPWRGFTLKTQRAQVQLSSHPLLPSTSYDPPSALGFAGEAAMRREICSGQTPPSTADASRNPMFVSINHRRNLQL
eukprot:bmy_00238T0